VFLLLLGQCFLDDRCSQGRWECEEAVLIPDDDVARVHGHAAGLPSSTPAVERLNGFKSGVKDNPKIQVVAEQAAAWLLDKAQTAFAAMLQAHPNIKAVYASNDMLAAGARLAAKGAGKLDQVKILGTDGLPGPAGGIRAVAEGEWATTFTYPTGGPEAIEMAKSILLDYAEKVPTVVTVPTTAITPDNAKQLMQN